MKSEMRPQSCSCRKTDLCSLRSHLRSNLRTHLAHPLKTRPWPAGFQKENGMATRRTSDGLSHIQRLPNGDWHPEAIKAQVRMRLDDDGVRWTLGRLALAAGLPAFACRHAIWRPHEGGELAIAALLGLAAQDIWSSRFRADGSRIPRVRSGSESTRRASPRHCENQEAA
jgi:lambda repressor-like predicted transcriptional regulator